MTNIAHKPSVLFVCMGNICRSPTAEAVFLHQLKQAGLEDAVTVDSAGTHSYHIGHPPDARSQEHALPRGYKMSELRSRMVTATDFEQFDWIVAMDWDNLALLEQQCPRQHQHKLKRLLEFADKSEGSVAAGYEAVPDPYYGGEQGFELVLDLVEAGCAGLLGRIQSRL